MNISPLPTFTTTSSNDVCSRASRFRPVPRQVQFPSGATTTTASAADQPQTPARVRIAHPYPFSHNQCNTYDKAIASMLEVLPQLHCKQVSGRGQLALEFGVSSQSQSGKTYQVRLAAPFGGLRGASCSCRARAHRACIHRARAYLAMQEWLETEEGWRWGTTIIPGLPPNPRLGRGQASLQPQPTTIPTTAVRHLV